MLKSTFTDNIYPFLNPADEDYIYLETSKKFFKGFLEIIRRGNSIQNYSESERSFKRSAFYSVLDNSLKSNANFDAFIRTCFTPEVYLEIAKDFGLNFSYFSNYSNDNLNLFNSYSIKNECTSKEIIDYTLKDVSRLNNKENLRAFFIEPKGEFRLELKENVRSDRIYVKPFTASNTNSKLNSASNSKIWNETGPSSLVYVSSDGENWEVVGKFPESYGKSNKLSNFVVMIKFDTFFTFNHIKIEASADSSGSGGKTGQGLSISYLGFKN